MDYSDKQCTGQWLSDTRIVEERGHRVADYAARLGYSVRTLTRATRAATGRGAKRFIDEQILLEAKRLLFPTDVPPSTIGERLGFTYSTAFSAFFQQRTGMTPTVFRTTARGTFLTRGTFLNG